MWTVRKPIKGGRKFIGRDAINEVKVVNLIT